MNQTLSPLYRRARRILPALGAVTLALSSLPSPATADLDTDPDLFTEQPIAATGVFYWDEFSAAAGFAGPHAPDVVSSGVGSAALSSMGVPQPMDGPPFGLVTGTQNLYTGGTIGHWDIDLAGLSTAEANTTVVLQLAALGTIDPASFLLDGAAPTTFVDRRVAPGVIHNIDGAQAPSDTSYYWAEWHVPPAAEYTLEFSGADTHRSLTGARVDYFNTADVFDALAASAVPEPSSIALVGLAIASFMVVGLRRRLGVRSVAGE